MFRAAFLRQVPVFLRNFSENVVLCLVAAAVESTIRRVTNQTKLHWRKALTGRMNTRYFADMVSPSPPTPILHSDSPSHTPLTSLRAYVGCYPPPLPPFPPRPAFST